MFQADNVLPPTVLITLLLAAPATSVQLFRCRGAAKDDGTLDYVAGGGEQNSPNAITKEKAAEIAADFRSEERRVGKECA